MQTRNVRAYERYARSYKDNFRGDRLLVISVITPFVFPDVLPVGSGFAFILSLPVALILVILTLISLIKEKKRLWPAFAAALIIAVFFFVLPRIHYWGALAHLYLHKRSYETTAQRMLAARNDSERRTICGEQCWLVSDHGPVAFHYIHGFLDWHDLIYDPTGRVPANTSWDERKRFDIYFISADQLTCDWYLGHFGD